MSGLLLAEKSSVHPIGREGQLVSLKTYPGGGYTKHKRLHRQWWMAETDQEWLVVLKAYTPYQTYPLNLVFTLLQ